MNLLNNLTDIEFNIASFTTVEDCEIAKDALQKSAPEHVTYYVVHQEPAWIVRLTNGTYRTINAPSKELALMSLKKLSKIKDLIIDDEICVLTREETFK